MSRENIPELKLRGCEKGMPVIGMGTASMPPVDDETARAGIVEAIRAGYRNFDTADMYGTEQPLGAAVAEALRLGLIGSRDDLFITTKLGARFAERDLVVPSIKTSLSKLELEYVDMYLIHLPYKLMKEVKTIPLEKDEIAPLDIKSVWEGMEECKRLGFVKGIGVSNFSVRMLRELLSHAQIPPAVNQVEMSVMWQQKKLREFCQENGIAITAYSVLGATGTLYGDDRVISNDVIQRIANAKAKTTAQIALRWVYEQGVSLVTKSYNKERMRHNLDIFDWRLTDEELDDIAQLPQRKGVYFAPYMGQHDFLLQIDAEL